MLFVWGPHFENHCSRVFLQIVMYCIHSMTSAYHCLSSHLLSYIIDSPSSYQVTIKEIKINYVSYLHTKKSKSCNHIEFFKLMVNFKSLNDNNILLLLLLFFFFFCSRQNLGCSVQPCILPRHQHIREMVLMSKNSDFRN